MVLNRTKHHMIMKNFYNFGQVLHPNSYNEFMVTDLIAPVVFSSLLNEVYSIDKLGVDDCSLCKLSNSKILLLKIRWRRVFMFPGK